MQLAQRQKIYEVVSTLAECAAPRHRERVLKLVETAREELRPDDKRQGAKSEEHRAKISAAFELRRQTEVFRIEYPELNNQSVNVIGIDNLVKAVRYTAKTIRVRFATGRGRFVFSYKGAELVAVRTSTFADAPDDGWEKGLDALIRG